MKNILIVDIDTDREKQIMFGKGNDFVMPSDETEQDNILLMDIQTLVDGLNHLLTFSGKEDLRKMIGTFLLESSTVDNSEIKEDLKTEETE